MQESFINTDCVNCGAGSDRADEVVTTSVTHECHLYGVPLRIASCRDCGLVFMTPRPLRASIERLYGVELYQQPKNRVATRPKTRKASIHDLHSVLNDMIGEPLRGKRVLDIGANEGRWLALFDRGNVLVGIEPSAAALRPVRDDISLIRSDLESAVLPDTFDLVTATALIEHLYDPLDGLVKMNARLRDGGRLFLYTPDIKGLSLRRGVSKYFKLVHLYYFSVSTLSSLLRKAGFAVEQVRVFPAFFSSALVFPQTGSAANFCLLARKVASMSYAEAARNAPSTGPEEHQAVREAIRSAVRRDRLVGAVSTLLNRATRVRNRTSGVLRARYPRVWSQLRLIAHSSTKRT